MPAQSKAQRVAVAIAEHEPDKLYARNKGLLGMSQQQMHDFAATPEKGLPQKVRRKRKPGLPRPGNRYQARWQQGE